jgi:hypothetical protein
MKTWGVIKWMLFFVATIAVAAGGGAAWIWYHSDSLIREKVLQAFDKAAPDLELHFDKLQFVSTSTMKLIGVEVRDRDTNRPILRADEVEAAVDESQLLERQFILVKHVRVHGVDVLLKRELNGRWNWQGYKFHRLSDAPFIPPSVRLEDVRIQIKLDHGDDLPAAMLVVSTPLFQAVPGSNDDYDFSGLIALPGAGNLAVSGDCNLPNKTFRLGGSLNDVTADHSLLEIAKSTAPQLAGKLAEIDAAIQRVLPKTATTQTTAVGDDSAAIVIGTSDAAPRFMGVIDVDFKVEKLADQAVPDLKLKIDLRDGQIHSSVIPIRLSDVTAKFYWDNSNVVVDLLNARDKDALITGQFLMRLGENAAPPRATVHLENFPVTSEFKPLFPPKAQKFFDHFMPVGKISGDIAMRRFASGKWLPERVSGMAVNSSILFHKFKYPVTAITAKMQQRPIAETASSMHDVIFDITAEGSLGNQIATTTGWIQNPGPELEMHFDVHVDNFSLDSRFRDALDEKGRKVIETMGITGVATADVACHRPPGLDQPTAIIVEADVRDAKMRFSSFAYDIEKLSGHVQFRSAEKHWTFTELRGWHKDGQLRGEGTFRGVPEPGDLDLVVRAENAALDADLFHALNASSRAVWTMMNPEGRISLTTRVAWTAAPGLKPIVRLEDIRVTDATIYPKPFPYRMSIKSAELSYDPNDPTAAGRQRCEIKSLKAEHDGAPITASGWAEIADDGLWQLHLDDLNATKLQPDDNLRAALPSSWRETLSRLSQKGLVSIEASQLDFRGVDTGDAPPTAAWQMNLRLEDCEIAAGLDLKKVSGLVKANGSWDGYQLINRGTIALDQIEVLDMTIAGINGPYTMTEKELVLGNREVIAGRQRPNAVPAETRIQGLAYNGTLQMDGLINLQAGSTYRFFGELTSALLESYARQHLPDQPNMKGVVNSWIFVTGDGDSPDRLTGKGQLQINPAALYEVPVVLEMFNALSKLNFAVPNRSAFDYALMSFEIHDQAFWFDPIDLVGDVLALRGRGSVGFGGDVVLDFFSRPNRPRTPRIPLTGILMNSATQWVNVQVRGTIDRPQTRVGSKMQLDASMRQFLGGFEPRPGGPVPELTIPSFGLLQQGPGQRPNSAANRLPRQ